MEPLRGLKYVVACRCQLFRWQHELLAGVTPQIII
ncbi:hypothetical protein QE357_000943 [Siphonobacter sp. BAB-5404]|nr:hypothetical protein [Siphonobacter sp. SORGH_AS_0500]